MRSIRSRCLAPGIPLLILLQTMVPPAGSQAQPPASTPAQAIDRRGPSAATVNGVPIFLVDLETAIAAVYRENRAPADLDEAKKLELRLSILDGLVGTELLFQHARSLKTEVTQAEIDDAMGRARTSMGEGGYTEELKRRSMTEGDLKSLIQQNLVVQKMIKETLVDTITVTEPETRKYYDDSPGQMKKPAGVEASHIMVRWTAADGPDKKAAAMKRIEEARARAAAGEDFAQVARASSEDVSASAGGVVGIIYPGQTHPAFEEAAFKLKAGELSGVVETPFGFHLIKASARHPEGIASFEEVRVSVGEFLRQRRSEEAIEKLVASLRSKGRIEIP